MAHDSIEEILEFREFKIGWQYRICGRVLLFRKK